MTVVIPARDAERTIAASLASILASDGAGAPAVIVVDDGSIDRTAAVAAAAASAARLLRTAGVGPGAARNAGIAAATTPFVAFCDADDRWPPGRLVDDLALFGARPALEVALGRTRFDTDDPALLEGLNFDRDERTAVIPHLGAATMRREVFARAGPVIEGTANYEDYDWFLRVREVGADVVVHDRVTLWQTLHAASTSRRNPGSPSDLIAVLRRSLDRRRRDGAARTLPRLSDLHVDESGPRR